jgi:uncharacterized heparinase superfamily protein
MIRIVWWRLLTPLRTAWRRSWFYRRGLGGRIADRIRFYPYDALPRRLEDADAAMRGRFRFAGETVDIREGSVFDKPPPSAAWERALHAFEWLPPLSAAGGEPARVLATNLIAQWIKRNGRYDVPSWSPEIMGRRLIHLFSHARLVLPDSDLVWRSKLFVSLREQARALARFSAEAPDGLPRLEAAAALALSGVCLDDSEQRLAVGLERLQAEIARQILPDGGHVSRSPETLVHAYRTIMMVMDALQAGNYEIPQPLRIAHDRMAPMIRFFRHGDGALALFNGGSEGDTRMIAGLLARDDVRGQPFGHAPHSGYQRIAAARTLVLMDSGVPPTGNNARAVHAGCLSFELSAGGQRIVVNCGSAGGHQERWESALRQTAAHSTLIVQDTSTGAILPAGRARAMLGPRLIDGPTQVGTRRVETDEGVTVEASHDGYVPAFGLIHERRLTLAPRGDLLAGVDRVTPKPGQKTPLNFAIRFHIHPDVRVSASQSGGVILKLPQGDGWVFKAQGSGIAVEESVYLGGATIRRTEQLVITGIVKDAPAEIGWMFEHIG